MNITPDINTKPLKHSWVTIGSFDGVHLGHQTLIKSLVEKAHACGDPAVVVTFWPHPAVFFNRAPKAYTLTSPEERKELIRAQGADDVLVLDFNQALANLTASQFMQRIKSLLDMKVLMVGPNFALGKGREGTVDQLSIIGAQLEVKVEVIHPVTFTQGMVSSSQIRADLNEYRVREASQKLGRPYRLTGQVVHGEHRGTGLGFPTANLEYLPDRLIPAKGVYATRAIVNGRTYASVTNIGVRPTFDNPLPIPRVEPHLLDMQDQLYQQQLTLEFIDFLRGEKKFETPQELIAQIQRDVDQTRQIFLSELGSKG